MRGSLPLRPPPPSLPTKRRPSPTCSPLARPRPARPAGARVAADDRRSEGDGLDGLGPRRGKVERGLLVGVDLADEGAGSGERGAKGVRLGALGGGKGRAGKELEGTLRGPARATGRELLPSGLTVRPVLGPRSPPRPLPARALAGPASPRRAGRSKARGGRDGGRTSARRGSGTARAGPSRRLRRPRRGARRRRPGRRWCGRRCP